MTAPVPEDKLRLGGMALRNGLLVHGPTHWAAAVRTDDGELKVASGRKPDLGAKSAEKIPGVRGVVKLAEAMAVMFASKRSASICTLGVGSSPGIVVSMLRFHHDPPCLPGARPPRHPC